MLTKNKMLSVNQTLAQIKLNELWKAINLGNNPLKFKTQEATENGITTRAVTQGKLIQKKGTTLSQDSFVYDATKIWNNAPDSIKLAKTLTSAKTEIKKYCCTLPM